jgi:cytochrome b involved in lipid metabolism
MPLERNMGEVRTYTYKEIIQHSSPDDLWMVLHGNVYDITSVIDSHPGGAEVLIDAAGTDSTIAFDEVGHSQDSLEMLKPLLVGVVDETDDVVFQRSSTPDLDKKRIENTSIGESKFTKQLKRKKRKMARDGNIVLGLAVLAMIAMVGYVWLTRRKWN